VEARLEAAPDPGFAEVPLPEPKPSSSRNQRWRAPAAAPPAELAAPAPRAPVQTVLRRPLLKFARRPCGAPSDNRSFLEKISAVRKRRAGATTVGTRARLRRAG